MADDIYDEIKKYSRSLWDSILVSLKDSLVYMDDGVAEVLHWSGRVLDVLDAGAKNIQSLDSPGYGAKNDKKVVFVLGSFLHGRTVDKIQKIIESSYFHHCCIFCTISENNHDLVLKKTGNVEKENFFEKFKDAVRFWMNNKYGTVDIRHVPLLHANIIPGLFFLPSFSSFSPVLPSDLSVIQEWLKSKGDHERIFNSLTDVELHHMPEGFQIKIKLLASALSDLFSGLNLTEDCYGIGHTAKLLATEVVNLSSTRKNSTTGGRCAVIFADRTLDMVQASSKSGSTLADKILELLPKHPGHNMDVKINMSSMCSSEKTEPSVVLPGSLARNPPTEQSQKLLTSMFTKKTQDVLSEIHEELVNVLKSESVSFDEDDHRVGKVTAEKLLSLLNLFRNNVGLFLRHSALLQLAMAAVNSLQHEHNSQLQQLQGTEKVLQLSLNEEDSPSCLSHILTLLDNVRQGTRSYCFEDVLLLLLHVYSLVGEECLDSQTEQTQLQTIIKDVLSGTLLVKTNLVLDMENDSKMIIRSKISRCFFRLTQLSNLRNGFVNFKDVFTSSPIIHDIRSYNPILKQIIGKVFDPVKAEIGDIEFKSIRLKDYIKSGFSLFMNVRKPHPSDYPVLFLFVIGGVTCSEVRCIMDHLSSHNIKAKVVIGGTKILNSQDALQSFFGRDNVFPNIEAS